MPARSHGWLRSWFRKVWNVRGGGLYACGFAISFLIYELNSIVQDLKEFGQLMDGQFLRFALNFLIDSLKNTVRAFMWPVEIVRLSQPWGAIALGAAFVVFPHTLKRPIERWLFAGEPPASDNSDDTESTSPR